MGWVVNATSRPLYPWERPSTHCLEGWVGPMAVKGKAIPLQAWTGPKSSRSLSPQDLKTIGT